MNEKLYPEFSILIVDDEISWLRSLGLSLERSGGITNLLKCSDSREVHEIIAANNVGVVLLDLTMPHISGEEILKELRAVHPDIAVIIISGMNQVKHAVDCMKLGALDYLVKTSGTERLITSVMNAVRICELERENRAMRESMIPGHLEHPEAFSHIITQNSFMFSVFGYIEAIAKTRQPVLITGESGTGKELIARSVHHLSRENKPLVSVNVAGLDDNIFSDTLFGHTRGAFTGADSKRKGMTGEAGDGTLFLDEIGDLSPASQVKLLRLLQENEYYAVGSDRPSINRARIVCSTHRNLTEKEKEGLFRKDLYYRLHTHHIHLPPLRERKDDIPLLLDHFLELAATETGREKPLYPRELPVLLFHLPLPGKHTGTEVHGLRCPDHPQERHPLNGKIQDRH